VAYQASSAPVQWQEVSTEFTTRAVAMTIYGGSDSGRSTLALTAPGPIAYIHSYEKVRGILERMRLEKEIKEIKFGGLYRGGPETVQKQADNDMRLVESAMSDAYRWARTIILDTEKRTWEIAQLARLGTMIQAERSSKDQKLGQLAYREINARWFSMLNEFRVRQDEPLQDGPTNLILICKTEEEYKKVEGSSSRAATGRQIISAQKDTYYFSDVVVRTSVEKRLGQFTYVGVVEKPWWNTWARGEELVNDELTFANVMALVTETDASEWE
jgi:hypothetical protein